MPFARIVPAVAIPLLILASSAYPVDDGEALSTRIASYRIAVALDTAQRTLEGTGELRWRNTSADIVRDLQFHLYLNAFRSNETTFMRQWSSRREPGSPDNRGWIDITSITVDGGRELKDRIEYIRPDDGNASDSTVCRIVPDRPVRPGRTAVVRFSFRAGVPEVIARTGYYGDFYMIGQWFPKIGVYQSGDRPDSRRGSWSCRQFHAFGEFFADFGVYDVAITVPLGYVVGATGTEQSSSDNGNGTRTVTFHAPDVHDFAWTASRAFLEICERWRRVRLRLLLQPHRRDAARKHLDAARETLEYMDRHVGHYPYETLTIVDPPYGGENAGGMEYPTLVTTSTFTWLPETLRWSESVTAHEVIHQYWQGMVANNETDEPWLDEGITQYYEDRLLDDLYGPEASFVDLPVLRVGGRAFTRSRYTGQSNPAIAPVTTPAWGFTRGGYGSIVYAKTSTVLATLEGLAGREVMDSAMQTYFRRWQFRHPSGEDFRGVLLEVIPRLRPDLSRGFLITFLRQMLDETAVCDYEVTSLSVRTTPRSGTDHEGGAAPGTSSRVILGRLGGVQIPVDVLVSFRDGSQVLRRWDGKTRTTELVFPGEVRRVVIDPDRKLLVDLNVTNNSRTLDPPVHPLWKIVLNLLVLLQAIVG